MSDYIVGIDPSLTGTAVCVMEMDVDSIRHNLFRFESKAKGRSIAERFERYQESVNNVFCVLDGMSDMAIYIEGYSFGSRGHAVLDIAEYGAMLRRMLIRQASNSGSPCPCEIAPTVVKKFATGKGNADKMQVAVGLSKRYGVEFGTSDEYDAYAIARIGACIAGWCEPQTDFQREAIDVVLHGRKKTKKKSA